MENNSEFLSIGETEKKIVNTIYNWEAEVEAWYI